MPADRWRQYRRDEMTLAAGWSTRTLLGPSALWGANGMAWQPRTSELLVTQVFGSQITAMHVDTGHRRVFSPLGAGIAGPDDAVVHSSGDVFATEPANGRVTVRRVDGSYAVAAADLPAANGITTSVDRDRVFVNECRVDGRLVEIDAAAGPPTVLAEGLDTPNAFTAGIDGALWFPQVTPGEIVRFDPSDGTLETRFTGLASPSSVKADRQGRLWVTEAASGEVTTIDPASGARETRATLEPGLDNVTVLDDGRAVVSHFSSGQVTVLAGGSTEVLSPPGLLGPFGLTTTVDGRVMVADGYALVEVGADGVSRRIACLLAGLPARIIDVAALDDALLVLVQRGQVLRRERDGRTRSIIGRLDSPTAIIAAPEGGAYLAEAGAGRIVHVDDGGEIRRIIADGLGEPRDLAVDDRGALWCTHRGGLSCVAGGPPRSFPVEDPHGVAIGGGIALVAEPARRRLTAVPLTGGEAVVAAADIPIGSPVEGAAPPHAFAPLDHDGIGFVVGCNGDGSVRLLSPPT